MGIFYIDTESGELATHEQLRGHDLLEAGGRPQRPWHRIQATSDASTLWYAPLRKNTRGIWLGALAMRSGDHYRKLLDEGWEEVPPERVGASLTGEPSELAPTPFDSEAWERLNGRLTSTPKRGQSHPQR
jgi:hypothetical protein